MGQIIRKLKIFDFHQHSKRKGKKGRNACIHAYGNMFDLRRNSYGNQCCPRGCGRGRRFADEETYMKESEPATAYARMVIRKLRPCADCCYDGRSETAKALCCATFGALC